MIPEEGSLRRTLKLGKNLYHASAMKKKVGDLRKRVHDAQQDVLVRIVRVLQRRRSLITYLLGKESSCYGAEWRGPERYRDGHGVAIARRCI